MTFHRDYDPSDDHDEPEPIPPAWCPECQAMVKPKAIDFGIGPWEMGSQTGWHHDWMIGCPDCECTDLTEEEPGTECRLCGEVEPCRELGLCASCLTKTRNRIPEARL